MADPRGIRAGRAYVELGVQNKIQKGLRAASAQLRAWGASVRVAGTYLLGVGGAALAGLGVATKSFMSMGDELDKMSSRVGASVEFLSALGYAAKIGGTDIGAMEVGIRRLQRSALDADRGLSTAKDAFAQLGVEIHDAHGALKPTEQLFMEAAAALSRVENNTTKAALATMIFGRAGTSLLPMLEGGEAGLTAMMEEAKKLGYVISAEDAKAAALLTDQVTRLKNSLYMGLFRIGAALQPILSDLAEKLRDVAARAADWLRENSGYIVSAAKLAAVVAGAGIALYALGAALSVAATGLTVLCALVGALLSPVGLTVAAIAGIAAVLMYTTDVGQKALSWLGDQFNVLKSDALATFGAIGDALAAGDIGLAAKVLWGFLKLEFLRGINAITGLWLGFKKTFLDIATGAWYGAQAALVVAWSGLQRIWIVVTSFLSSTWAKFCATLQNIWETTQNWLVKRMHDIHGLLDDTFDVDAAKALTDQTTAAIKRRIGLDKEAALAKVEAERAAGLGRVGAEEKTALAGIGEKELKAQAQHAAQQARDLADAQAEVDQAKKEWEGAVAQAKAKGAAARAPGAAGQPDYGKFKAPGIDAAALANAITVQGTFSARAAAGFAATSSANRTAKATEETAKNTAKLVTKFRNPLIFWK